MELIRAVTAMPEGWPASEMDTAPPAKTGTTMFFNEQPGADLAAVYPWIELGVA